jgi:polyisoprenoid-binding protein YceI
MRVLLLGAAALLATQPVNAAAWSVDYAKSKLGFAVLWSKEPFSAQFNKWSAAIDFDPSDIAHAHAAVTIDLASEASDEADFDSGLKGAEGFETSRFPAARFDTTSITHKSGNAYVASGTLNLHGITRSVTLPFTLTISGKSAHMMGTAHVLRTDFSLGQGEWAGTDPVAHDVSITVDLVATRP